METHQAEENLNVIRTIMERAALYRRRLGPIMLVPGIVGTALGVGGLLGGMEKPFVFLCSWIGAAVLAFAACLLVSRAQAKGEGEAVFSPSARRVLSAMMPSLGAAFLLTVPFLSMLEGEHPSTYEGVGNFALTPLLIVWLSFYGTALAAAGQYSSRGVRLLGWAFIATAACVIPYHYLLPDHGTELFLSLGPYRHPGMPNPFYLDHNFIMAITFGGYHLAAAAYLFLTEKRGPTT